MLIKKHVCDYYGRVVDKKFMNFDICHVPVLAEEKRCFEYKLGLDQDSEVPIMTFF